MVRKFKYDVFLSHNSKDKSIVRPIAEELKQIGLKVWFDEWKIKIGDDITLKVEKGLEGSKFLIDFISPNSIKSKWVTLERNTILFNDPLNSKRKYIPVLIKKCTIPPTLKRYRYVDCRDKESGDSLNELYAYLKKNCVKSKTK